VVFIEPFLGLNKSIMAKLLQNFKGGSTDLLSQFLGIMDDNFGLSSDLRHDISQDDLNLSLHRCNDVVDSIFELLKFL